MTKIFLQQVSDLHEARYAAAADIDFIGFNFDPVLGTVLTIEEVLGIEEWIIGIKKVAVFGEDNIEKIQAVLSKITVDYVQINTWIPPQELSKLNVPIIKKIPIVHDVSFEQLNFLIEPYKNVVKYFLLDGYNHNIMWGSFEHQPFEWKVIAKMCQNYPCFVGFNLTVHTALEVIEQIKPFGVAVHKGIRNELQELDFDAVERIIEIKRETNP
jgi:phosphoribosylanthranilate isomerase